MEILDLKKAITEIKKESLDEPYRRMEMTEKLT